MSAPTTRAGRPTVVIACAGIDARAIHPLASLVVRTGGRVDVMAGVEIDASPVRDRCESGGRDDRWWLVAESEELDEFQVALILELLRQSDVAAERILTVELAAADSLDKVEQWLHGKPGWDRNAARPRHRTMPPPAPASSVPFPQTPETDDATTRGRTTPTGSWVAPGDDAANESPSRARWRGAALALLTTAASAAAVMFWVRGASTPDGPMGPGAVAEVVDAAVPTHGDGAAAQEPAPAAVAVPESGPTEVPLAARPTRPADPMANALESRRIRAIDELLVAHDAKTEAPRKSAAATCGNLVAGGADAWRLPTLKEMRRLSKARFVDVGGRYWVAGPRHKPPKRAKVSRKTGTRARKAGRNAVADTLCVTTAFDAQSR